jgi:hypothetical protein
MVVLPDARPPDAAPTPDAPPPAPDARIDAAPLPPDAPTTDAPPPCESDEECVGAGVICVDDDTEVTCVQIQPGCFQVDETTQDDCGPNQACEDGAGCECVDNPACAAAGEFCTEAGIVTCTADADGCLVDSDPVACPDPTVCDPDAGGPNAAECVCPAVGTEETTGCQGTPVNTITCSADDSDVVRCELVGEAQCQVWRSLDNCAADGLECNQNDCVCPDNTEGDRFWAIPDDVIDRSERPPELIIPTGVREPAICSFSEMSTAIAFAIEFSGPNNIFDTYAIASNDNGTPDGADDPVARFQVEVWPWPRIPDNVTVTSEDDAAVGGSGNLNPANFVMVVNSHDESTIVDVNQNPNASVHLSGRYNRLTTTRGGAVKGMTFERGLCRFTEDRDEGCIFPEVAMFIDGVSNPVGAAGKLPAHERPNLIVANARVDRVNFNGQSNGELDLARAGDEEDCLDDGDPTDPVSGIFTGGAVTSPSPPTAEGEPFPGTFLFRAPVALSMQECFDEDGIFDDVRRGDWFVIDSGPNAGTYFIEDIRRSSEFFLAGRDEDDILILRGSGTNEGDVTSTWSVRSNSVGSSGFDGDSCGTEFECDRSWRFAVVNTGAGIFNQVGVFNFASGSPTDHGRAGILQVGNSGDQDDPIDDDGAFWAALTLDFNDVGYVHDNGVAWITSGIFGDQRSTITNSNGMGVFVEEGVLDVEHLTVTGTRGGFSFSNGVSFPTLDAVNKGPAVAPLFPFDWDGDGDGIRVVNWDLTQTTWSDVISTLNARHGAYVGNPADDDTDPGELLCYNDRGWDGDEFYGPDGNLESGFEGPCEDFNERLAPGTMIETEDGFVDWSGAQLSGNFINGLTITDYGTVVQNGGDISDNGVFGIGIIGYSVFNAGSATVGDGTDPLHVENNGVGGLANVRGEANLTDTVFTNNGTLNLCEILLGEDWDDEDMRGPAVFIGKVQFGDFFDEGTLHAINIEVVDNNGAGIVINSTGDDNYEPDDEPVWGYPDGLLVDKVAGKLPARDEAAARRNTIEDSLVDGNLGIGGPGEGCVTETEFFRWPTSGVEVWHDGILHPSNSSVSSSRGNAVLITNNAKGGLWVAGQYVPPTPNTQVTDPPGATPPINENSAPSLIEGNGWTGATVFRWDGARLTLGAGSRVNNNGHATGAGDARNDGVFVMGGITSLTSVEVNENFDDGVYVSTPANDVVNGDATFQGYTPSFTRVTLDTLEVRANGDDGMYLIGAPGDLGVVEGTSNTTLNANYEGTLMDVDPQQTFGEYGIVIRNPSTVVAENGGDGIQIGVGTQAMNVTVWMDRGDITLNDGVGIRAIQNSGYNANTSECVSDEGDDGDLDDDGTLNATDTDDDGDGVLDGADTAAGQKATERACSGVTIHGMKIFDNVGEGFYLNGAYVVPRTIESAPGQFSNFGVGWTSNEVYHNAIGEGCTTPQSRPQVMVQGFAPQDPDLCNIYATQELCQETSDGNPVTEENQHCFWNATVCIPIYDLRGTLNCSPETTGNANAIHSYNTTTDQTEYSVGMYAETGAFVWADNNRWREPVTNFTDNVDQASGAFVDADSNCGGSELNCVGGP